MCSDPMKKDAVFSHAQLFWVKYDSTLAPAEQICCRPVQHQMFDLENSHFNRDNTKNDVLSFESIHVM